MLLMKREEIAVPIEKVVRPIYSDTPLTDEQRLEIANVLAIEPEDVDRLFSVLRNYVDKRGFLKSKINALSGSPPKVKALKVVGNRFGFILEDGKEIMVSESLFQAEVYVALYNKPYVVIYLADAKEKELLELIKRELTHLSQMLEKYGLEKTVEAVLDAVKDCEEELKEKAYAVRVISTPDLYLHLIAVGDSDLAKELKRGTVSEIALDDFYSRLFDVEGKLKRILGEMFAEEEVRRLLYLISKKRSLSPVYTELFEKLPKTKLGLLKFNPRKFEEFLKRLGEINL